MNGSNFAAQERAAHDRGTDPRDDTILVGIDTDGCHHILKTEGATDTLLVVEGIDNVWRETDVVWRQDNVDADAWMDHIAERREWADRRLGGFDEVYANELAALREAT